MRYYLAPVAFLAFGLYARWRFGNFFTDPAVVTHPEKRLWSLFRWFDNDEWTPAGRVVRRQFVRLVLLGLAVSVAIMIVADAS